ncbi:MAG: EamA family transporter [Saprospiraceae bacterium]|nr:EamA family transporter [Saprospiraceae bacterium]MCB0625896.1 EamA family transporter [Saprospiraceae bacterium]MCB0676539.1 EamA family transporter [Saprospiraceae bacterium]MCB0682228.1 EamA family transporter [Saprospiraceae bacterium]
MDPTRRAYAELHLAVFLFGFTAILGDLIQLSALVLVWWRVLLTSLSLLFIVRLGKLFTQLPRAMVWKFMGIGVLVGLHWVTFYGSIKLANASIALVAFATTTFFTSILEPLVFRQRIKGYELALGLFIVPGMILIANDLDWSKLAGLLVGLLSAFLVALFATFNKKHISRARPVDITFLELGSAWLFLSLIVPYYLWKNPEALFLPSWLDALYLLVLVLLCTTLAYVLTLRALQHITAFAANLTINLEPVYGIVLAWLILKENEELSLSFYLGVAIILSSVFSYPFLKRRYGEKRVAADKNP